MALLGSALKVYNAAKGNFDLTERLTGKKNLAASTYYNKFQAPKPVSNVYIKKPTVTTAKEEVLGAQNQAPIGPSPTNTRAPINTGNFNAGIESTRRAKEDAAGADRDALMSAIDNEFKSLNDAFSTQEQALSTQLPISEQQITSEAASDVSGLTKQEQEQQAALEQQGVSAEQSTQGVLNKARQTYNELLSGASRFGGSAQQAFGELLGRSTSETMGQARTNLQAAKTQIAGELTRVKQFYNDKRNEIDRRRDLSIQQLRADFQAERNKIRDSRTQTQRWKADQNLAALADFQGKVAQITDAANTAKMALEKWNMERNAAAADVATFVANPYIPQLGATDLSIIPRGVEASQGSQQSAPAGIAGNQKTLEDILYGGF